MSVINQMLKDLDKRQQGHQLSHITPHQLQYVERTRPAKHWILLSLLSLVLGALALYVLQSWTGAQQGSQDAAMPSTSALASSGALSSKGALPSMAAAKPSSAETSASADTASPAGANATLGTHSAARANSGDINPAPTLSAEASAVSGIQRAAANTPGAIVSASAVSAPILESAPVPTPAPAATPAATSPAAHSGAMAVTEVNLTPKQLAQKQLVLAKSAEGRGELREALSHYQQALTFNPGLHAARKQQAALLYGQEQLSEASAVLAQGVLLYPQEFEFALLLARVQQAQGKGALALESLELIP
ncbi:MAG: tetratricopeptide repeat protein, partial [Shewanella sp.]